MGIGKRTLTEPSGGGFDVIVRGHTHRSSISHENDMLVINPGEVCGYVSGTNSLGFLDTEKRFAWLCELI